MDEEGEGCLETGEDGGEDEDSPEGGEEAH